MLQLMMSWLCESHEGKMALASPELAPLLIQASDILERLAYQREDSCAPGMPAMLLRGMMCVSISF